MHLICSIFLPLFVVVFRPLVPLAKYAANYDYISEIFWGNCKDLFLNQKLFVNLHQKGGGFFIF